MYANLALEHQTLKDVLSRKDEPDAATDAELGDAAPTHRAHAALVAFGSVLRRRPLDNSALIEAIDGQRRALPAGALVGSWISH